MLAIVLHKLEVRIEDYKRGLKYENIDIESVPLNGAPLNPEIFNANIILLAIKSPEIETLFETLSKLKQKKPYLPIIVVDEIEDDEARNKALSLGAYKYFAKPISYRDLAIIIKQLTFKFDPSENKCLRAFDIKLDMEHRIVRRNKYIYALRNKEFSLLEFFIINKGKIVTRNSILEHVWDRNANFASNTVDVHINRLRRKIDDPFKEKLIHTVHCVGYVFERRKVEKKKKKNIGH